MIVHIPSSNLVGVTDGVAVNVVVVVGVWVRVLVGVCVGEGVGGIDGHPTKNSHAVPINGAVTTTKQV